MPATNTTLDDLLLILKPSGPERMYYGLMWFLGTWLGGGITLLLIKSMRSTQGYDVLMYDLFVDFYLAVAAKYALVGNIDFYRYGFDKFFFKVNENIF